MSTEHLLNQSITSGQALIQNPIMSVRGLNVFYNQFHAVKNINLDIGNQQILALIGPSGCGKSSFLRCLNRMNDTISDCRITGSIEFDNQNILNKNIDPVYLRARVGMVFQKANPFPKSIFENIAFGIKIHGLSTNNQDLEHQVKKALDKVGLLKEVEHRLEQSALGLSGGQQQRLCIARAIAINPEIILMDEPCSALDPIATAKVEELIQNLKQNFSIVMVTHSMQQAKRLADRTAYFHIGELIEVNETSLIFNQPQNNLTHQYVEGKFG